MKYITTIVWLGLLGAFLFVASAPGQTLHIAIAIALVAIWFMPAELSPAQSNSLTSLMTWIAMCFALAVALGSTTYFLHQQGAGHGQRILLAIGGMICAAAVYLIRRRTLQKRRQE